MNAVVQKLTEPHFLNLSLLQVFIFNQSEKLKFFSDPVFCELRMCWLTSVSACDICIVHFLAIFWKKYT